MADMMSDGSEWFAEQLKANCSESITYNRGSDSVTLSATIGRTEFELANEYGIVETFRSRDYIFTKSDLVLSGSATIPMSGDIIVEGSGSYEVLSPGGSQCYREDEYGQVFRVHTKKIT